MFKNKSDSEFATEKCTMYRITMMSGARFIVRDDVNLFKIGHYVLIPYYRPILSNDWQFVGYQRQKNPLQINRDAIETIENIGELDVIIDAEDQEGEE